YQLPNPAQDRRPGQARMHGQPQPVPVPEPRGPLFLPAAQQARAQTIASTPTVLAIGVSTGGPAALDVLLAALPGNFPLPVLIVQHMPEMFTKVFAERLNSRCKLRVHEAAEGDQVVAGTVS